MKQFIVLLTTVLLVSCGASNGEAPAADTLKVDSVAVVDSVKVDTAAVATSTVIPTSTVTSK